VLAVRVRLSNRVIGSVMGFGAGALLGAIAYELVPESLIGGSGLDIFAAFAAGTLTIFVCDWLIDNRGGRHRKKIAGERRADRGRRSHAGRRDGAAIKTWRGSNAEWTVVVVV
jgi:hypothetical protein